MHDLLSALHQALDQASAILRKHVGHLERVEHKSAIDLVTIADRQSEAEIRRVIADRFEAHAILGEEEGGDRGPSRGYRWIIDPLDGTTNFSHGLPLFAISIALERDGEVILGGVDAPLLGQRYVAARGQGATRNGERLRVSRAPLLDDALLVTGFPYDRRERIDHYLARWRAFLLRCQGVLRLGSAALDLCHVAEGSLDAFWEERLGPWDTAAGLLMVREAGGVVTDMQGGPFTPFSPSILASNGPLHDACLAVLRACDDDERRP